MGATNTSQKNIKFYQLKAKADETNNPYFGLSEKVDGKWQTTQKFDTLSGMLNSAEIKEKEYQGVKSNIFVIHLEDNEEKMQLEMTHNALSHSIINSLASDCNKVSMYLIQVWKKQANGKWFSNAKVEIGGTKTSWKIDPKTAPKKEQVFVNGQPFKQQGKDVYDDSKLRTFYEEMFKNEIIAKLGSPVKPTSTASSETVTDVTPITDTPHGDLPF